MKVLYKRATEEDIPIVAELAERIWKEHYKGIITTEQINYMLKKMYSPKSLLQQLSEGHQFIIAKIDNKPLGYAAFSKKEGNNYFIHKFYIDVPAHRKGLGTQLFNYILKLIPEAETIELAVNRENYKAINFYFKQGFTIKNTFDLNIGGGFYMNDFLMIRKRDNSKLKK